MSAKGSIISGLFITFQTLLFLAGLGLSGFCVFLNVVFPVFFSPSSSYLSVVVWSLFAGGIAMALAASLTAFAAILKSKCLYRTSYVLSLTVILAKIVFLVWIVFYSRCKLKREINEALDRAILHEYDGKMAASIDLVQHKFECCGSSNYAVWIRPETDAEYALPRSCCLEPESMACNANRKMGVKPFYMEKVIFDAGCTDSIHDFVVSYYFIVLVAVAVSCSVEMISLTIAGFF